jgi:DNA topoisomerase-1
MSSLVIVESPTKARTLSKILGKGFSVKASVGHILDLPAKKLGVDVDNDFAPEYGVIPGKEKIIKELRSAAKSADKIYLAPDPDREGEAIAYHIASEIQDKKRGGENIYRITFNEITPKAVKEAVTNPGRIDMNRVEAQQARRVLDRLVGYSLSPLLWRKIRKGLSAGRVQSVALRLVVEREREIEKFKSQEYWSIAAALKGKEPPEFKATLHKYGGETVISRPRKFLITDEKTATEIAAELGTGKFTLAGVDKKHRRRSPAPPFTTSTVQQEAARKLGFSAKKTMLLAQQLYEGIALGEMGSHGLITYMRTDSVRVAAESQAWARDLIQRSFGKEYVPSKPPVYKSKKSAQEAHEAIRPTRPDMEPKEAKPFLSRDQNRLYTLIWNRFIASQMKPAELDQTTLDISCLAEGTEAVFRATGTVVKFPGFTALYTEGSDEATEEAQKVLPKLEKGDALDLKGLEPAQHFTQPPPRYSEATLVKTLEEKGIGRPSTYASILSTIVDRKYVQKKDARFSPTELGSIVNDYLVENFSDLLDVGFTAKMEDELDLIESGSFQWVKAVGDFYGPFNQRLTAAQQVQGKVKPEDIPTEEVCEKCGSSMVIRWGRHGRFFACSGYPECKNTKPLDGEKPSAPEEPTDEVCDKCGSPMVIKSGRFGKFIACSGYPKCKTTKPIPTGVKCPEDGGDLIQRRSKRGRTFWSCSNYPKCKFAIWNKPTPEKCPNCGAEFLLIKKERSGDTVKSCHNKECGFKAELAEPAEESAA